MSYMLSVVVLSARSDSPFTAQTLGAAWQSQTPRGVGLRMPPVERNESSSPSAGIRSGCLYTMLNIHTKGTETWDFDLQPAVSFRYPQVAVVSSWLTSYWQWEWKSPHDILVCLYRPLWFDSLHKHDCCLKLDRSVLPHDEAGYLDKPIWRHAVLNNKKQASRFLVLTNGFSRMQLALEQRSSNNNDVVISLANHQQNRPTIIRSYQRSVSSYGGMVIVET